MFPRLYRDDRIDGDRDRQACQRQAKREKPIPSRDWAVLEGYFDSQRRSDVCAGTTPSISVAVKKALFGGRGFGHAEVFRK